MASSNPAVPILDSHVHLFPKTHATKLSWTEGLPEDHHLMDQHSVDQYRDSSASASSNLVGLIFMEADRKVTLEEENWTQALDEVSFASRVVKGAPIAGEGHGPDDGNIVLGFVPWAPLPAGPAVLEKYLLEVQKRCSEVGIDGGIIKGYRYLLQSKPAGTAIGVPFIQSLLWLGGKGYTFDLGVDAHSGGDHELPEACQMLEKIYGDESNVPGKSIGSKLKIIINHLCKPNLHLSPDEATAGHPDFVKWSQYIETMASYPRTYMKLSGLFSEMPPQEDDAPIPVDELVKKIKPWCDVALRAFGPSRIMWGSNWPILSANGPGPRYSWSHWRDVASALLSTYKLSKDDQARVWGGTAAEAYNITNFASASV